MENQMDNYMEATKVVFFDGWPSLHKPSCILYMHASWKMAWVQPLPLSIPKNVPRALGRATLYAIHRIIPVVPGRSTGRL